MIVHAKDSKGNIVAVVDTDTAQTIDKFDYSEYIRKLKEQREAK